MTRPTRHLAAQLKRLVEKPAGSGDGPERHNQARVNQEQLAVQNEELRQAQATLEEARDRFVELYDFAPNGYLTLDGNGVIRQINLTGAALFGKAKAAIEGMPVLGLVRGPDRGRMLEYLRRCRRLKAGSVVEGEFTFRMADHRRTVQLITRPHGEDESARREYFTTMIDISEERRLEQEQEAGARERAGLARRLISIQEEERRRIARDLHDNIGQLVTALQLKLDAIAMAAADEPVRKRILEAQTAAEQIDRALDFIAAELRPAVLDLGLVAALEQFVREWSVTFAIPAELHVSGVTDAQLEQEVETHLYRVAQEALHNAYKHAEASRVELIFERRGSSIVLIIEDDGCGFHPDHAATTHRGLGLLGMRERAEIVGGSLEIESAPGRGTTVFFQVPCPSRGGARVDTA